MSNPRVSRENVDKQLTWFLRQVRDYAGDDDIIGDMTLAETKLALLKLIEERLPQQRNPQWADNPDIYNGYNAALDDVKSILRELFK